MIDLPHYDRPGAWTLQAIDHGGYCLHDRPFTHKGNYLIHLLIINEDLYLFNIFAIVSNGSSLNISWSFIIQNIEFYSTISSLNSNITHSKSYILIYCSFKQGLEMLGDISSYLTVQVYKHHC